MSDIKGDAFTIQVKETIEKGIEHVGKTASQMQVGKALAVDGDDLGPRLAQDGDNEIGFIGIIKAASGEARVNFAETKIVNDVVTGANPTMAPYFDGNVTIPEGKPVTVERNCITYVMIDGDIQAGQLIACAADGKFKAESDPANAVGRAYSSQDANGIARVYIRAL